MWFSWSTVCAFSCGIVTLLLIEFIIIYYLFFRNSSNHSNFTSVPSTDAFTFPQQLFELITEKLGENTTEGTVLLNLLLQFWFRENRYDVNILTAIANKINSELIELLSNTSLGRIFNSLKIHDLELGSESPIINFVSLQKVDINKELRILNNFVFEFDIKYVGGFYMAIDALMKFNSNAAFVSVKVVKCVGRVRVEFTRIPYTYWCMSFVNPPELELVVQSKLEGRSVPQLNRIIGIQLRRRINRKFVMPFYKIRSKPFLPTHNLINLKDDVNQISPNGTLQISVISLSRIIYQSGFISCSLTIDSNQWVEDVQSTTNQTYLLQLFRRSTKDPSSLENRKLSTGSLWYDKHHDGLRQRLKSLTSLNDSCTNDEYFRRKSFVDSTVLVQKLSFEDSNQLDREESLHQTKRQPYSEVIIFNESFEFFIRPDMRYLTVLVWNHDDEKLVQSERLIGYISIPLCNLIHSRIGRKRRIFYLKPPNSIRNHIYSSLSTHPGFNQMLCYGDITLGVKFISATSLSPALSSNESTPISLSPTRNIKQSSILFENNVNLADIDSELNVHEFDRIVINKPTKCEFCQRKIWLKEASHCLKCGLICHKKCVVKCEKGSECRVLCTDGSTIEKECIEVASQAISINPEIITTAPDNNEVSGISKNKFSAFLANVKSISRSGSTSNLAPPAVICNSSNQAHSLPQTPNNSPSPSRKTSIFVNNVKLFETEESPDEVDKALNYLLTMPKTEQFLEHLINSGRKLCVDLYSDTRENRINNIISKIRIAIDSEIVHQNELKEKQKIISEFSELTSLGLKIGKSEIRTQALTNLLLHCCSGLQDTRENVSS